MKTIVHVNQHNIKANAKYMEVVSTADPNATLPVLTVKTYKNNQKGNTAEVIDKEGVTIGKFIYSPDKPLSCGAKVWFETQCNVVVQE